MRYLLILLILAGCQNQATKTAKEKKIANDYFAKNRDELALKCKTEFPNLITEYVKGNETIKVDTIYQQGEIIECPEPTEQNPKPVIKCPDTKSVIKYVDRIDTLKVADTREIYLRDTKINEQSELLKELGIKLSETELKLLKEQDTKKKFKNLSIILAILLSIGILAKIKRVI